MMLKMEAYSRNIHAGDLEFAANCVRRHDASFPDGLRQAFEPTATCIIIVMMVQVAAGSKEASPCHVTRYSSQM
eukprot:IDg23753t1